MSSPTEDTLSQYSVAPPPVWIKEHDFSLDPIVKSSQVDIQGLLEDIQKNWEEKTAYYHRAKKALNKAGVQQISQLRFNFAPSYEKIVLHSLRILRNGECLDRLENSRHEILQREERLDKNLYDGTMTLVYFLDDVRIGDVLEYSFSFVGCHPLFSSHYSDVLFFQNDQSFEKRCYRVLIHPDRTLAIKPFHISVEPQITDLSPTLREFSWETDEIPPITYDKNLPSWYNPLARVQISQYSSWQTVVEKLLPLYTLSEDLESNLPYDMVDLVTCWKESSKDPMTRATLATRFVQDEVRYQGFEEGIKSHMPTDPHLVFQRRFGDCKDKTMLLHMLLKFMDIPSTPVLVHSHAGIRLPELLPFPGAFNHIVLQIQIDNSSYWIDSTISLQGGSLQNSFFPNYRWGLPLFPNSTNLIQLPKPVVQKPQEITSTFVFTSPDFADLTITTHSYEDDADWIRGQLVNEDIKKTSERYFNHIHKKYRGAIVTSPLSISDDREKNIIMTIESYRIPSRQRAGNKILKLYLRTIEDRLHKNILLDRTSPYAIPYPSWVKEHIHIENPFNTWSSDTDALSFEHESLHYSHVMETKETSLDFTFELKHLQDHVAPAVLNDYWNIINAVEPYGTFEVVITPLDSYATD